VETTLTPVEGTCAFGVGTIMAATHFKIVLAYYSDTPIARERSTVTLGSQKLPYHVARLGLKEFGDPSERPEAHDDFERAINACLLDFAVWLSQISSEEINATRSAGLNPWVIVNLWIDSDQMDFHLPPLLSTELGRLGLELYILSNE